MKKAKFKVNQIISFLDEQNSDQEKRGVIEASNYLLRFNQFYFHNNL